MISRDHPYKELESLPAWKAIARAVKQLVANGDLREQTPREYIVGLIVKELQRSDAMESRIHHVKSNGAVTRPSQKQTRAVLSSHSR